MVAPVTTYSTLEMGSAILGAATLSFLGLGVNPPTPEWGAIASAGRQFLRSAPHLVLFPSLAIFFAVWSFNVLGDVLRDAMDPKMRSR
jgi:peptide/nickel transport system permease protein